MCPLLLYVALFLVCICDECDFESYQWGCVICGGLEISDAYSCKECTIQAKIEIFAQNLSIWGALREICSMSAKDTGPKWEPHQGEGRRPNTITEAVGHSQKGPIMTALQKTQEAAERDAVMCTPPMNRSC